jgi:hypothetical protein
MRYPEQKSFIESFSERTEDSIGKVNYWLMGEPVEYTAENNNQFIDLSKELVSRNCIPPTGGFSLELSSDLEVEVSRGICFVNNIMVNILDNTILDISNSEDYILSDVPPVVDSYVYVVLFHDLEVSEEAEIGLLRSNLEFENNSGNLVILGILDVKCEEGSPTLIDKILVTHPEYLERARKIPLIAMNCGEL